MKLPDTNLWLALSLSKHTHHSAARAWLDRLDEPDNVCFCRSTQQSFLRLLTSADVMSLYGNRPLSNKGAWAAYDRFIADDRIVFQPEAPGLSAMWKTLAVRRTNSPKLWMDAYLAAFAIAGGAQLITIDNAFRQFPGLDVLVIDPSR